MNGFKRAGTIGAIVLAAATLGACVEDGYGYGGGVAVGYGPGYDGYYDGYYGAYGDPYFGTSYPGYYGWYGGYYYPGSGYYVYGRDRRPIRWNGDQRRYWSGQQHAFRRGPDGGAFRPGGNWSGFDRGAGAGAGRPAGQAFRGGGRPGGGGGHFGGGGRHR